jgi:hypothetical protein
MGKPSKTHTMIEMGRTRRVIKGFGVISFMETEVSDFIDHKNYN